MTTNNNLHPARLTISVMLGWAKKRLKKQVKKTLAIAIGSRPAAPKVKTLG